MTKTSVGIDMQEIKKIKNFLVAPRAERLFSAYEINYLAKKALAPQTATGMFCAKEAFFKATGRGINVAELNKVEVHHDEFGAPYYKLASDIISKYELENADIALSITHTKQFASAVCIITFSGK